MRVFFTILAGSLICSIVLIVIGLYDSNTTPFQIITNTTVVSFNGVAIYLARSKGKE